MSCECACHRLGVEIISADCPCNPFPNAKLEANSFTVTGEPATMVDEIAVWDPEAVIRAVRGER